MTHGQPDDLSLQNGQNVSDQATAQPDGSLGTPAGAEQKVSWLELFFDLIFVVAFDQLAKRLGDSVSLENVGVFALMFTAVWWSWSGNSTFAARYGNESRVYRWGTVAQLVSMAMIALAERGDLEETGGFFAVAFGLNRLIHAALHLWADRQSPEALAYSRAVAAAAGVTGALWLGSALLPGGGRAQLTLWGLALALDILAPILIRQKGLQALPHEAHLPERVGLLQIIALGTVITEIVSGGRGQRLSAATLLPAFLSILTTVALWRLYFDQARSLPLLAAHLAGRVGSMLAWLYGHLPFTLSVVMLGVGLGHGISSGKASEIDRFQPFVVWSLAGAFATLAFLRWNSRRVAGQRGLDRSLVTLLAAALGAALLSRPDLDTRQLHGAAALLTVTAAVLVATDPATRRLGQLEQRVSEVIEERAEALQPEGT
ncbi:Low temperature requirement protein LtrA [Deinococcus reticulitermitis]|uniref:Low temperature requirement protein LtrA n=1 Tax=Deinococcus reticulitermitis TaxID=856736 RepID=A0A1H7ATK8_9DEIO|nr:low temperature requirement protein A [Deinococcus reticulitermitis]SEJ68933.1 Low temperature requirement protein LtrA [Deinococcus reticulitermitis]